METTAARRPVMSWTFLELLDRTFRIYRDNFLTFIGISLLVMIPATILNLLVTLPSLSALSSVGSLRSTSAYSNYTSTVCLSSLVSAIVTVLELVFTYGPMIYATSESQMGRKVSIGEAFRGRQNRFSKLGFGFVLFYIVLVIFIAAIILFVALIRWAPVLAVLGVVAYIGIAGYAMLPPVLMLENIGVSPGISRAWALGKARFWTILGVVAAIGVITVLISVAFGALAQVVFLGAARSSSIITGQIATTLVNSVIGAFTTPLLPIGLALLYYDTRTRLEGLDITLETMENLEARPWDVPASGLSGALNGKDLRNIVILTVGALAISLLFGAAMVSLMNGILPSGGL